MSFIDGAAYISFVSLIVLTPILFLDWALGIVYQHCRWFRKRLNRFWR